MNRTSERTIEMLEIISKQINGISLKEIVEIMNIPKSSAFDILHTLIKLRVVSEKEGKEKKYVIGVKAFEIGSTFMKDIDLISKAKYELEELSEKLNKTTFIGVLDDEQILYVYKHQASNAKITASNVGSKNDLYNTSLGKAILAHLDKSKQLAIIDRINFITKTQNTIIDKNIFIKELEKVRKLGYAVDNRELENHMLCFGAPVFDYTGNVIASISVSGLYDDETNFELNGEMIKETAAKISAKLGKLL
ncbi:MAG: IclR family transcriptional regulator [Haloplasmataceae bacterium]|jgi:DNA-binding IclR family transcriptional regulator|nr:IclR family transcriptional regulator [Haloplasmataceae bacterium]